MNVLPMLYLLAPVGIYIIKRNSNACTRRSLEIRIILYVCYNYTQVTTYKHTQTDRCVYTYTNVLYHVISILNFFSFFLRNYYCLISSYFDLCFTWAQRYYTHTLSACAPTHTSTEQGNIIKDST